MAPVSAAGTVAEVFRRAREVFTDEDGIAGGDCGREGDDRDPAELIVEETVLPVGAVASAHGTWSAQRGAIVAPGSGVGDAAVKVALGPPEALAADTGLASFGSYLAFATLSTALGVAIVWFALRVPPGPP